MKKKKSAESDTIHTLQLDRGLSSLTWLMGRVSWSLLRNSFSPCYTRRKERKNRRLPVPTNLRQFRISIEWKVKRWIRHTHVWKDIKWHPFFPDLGPSCRGVKSCYCQYISSSSFVDTKPSANTESQTIAYFFFKGNLHYHSASSVFFFFFLSLHSKEEEENQ